MGQAKYKPLSFNTTLRNPERIAGFLKCIEQFEGKVLTNGLIDGIVKKIINEKLYRPKSVNSKELYKTIFDSDDKFNSNQLEDIVKNAPQDHKEAGFDKGWPSRFDTWYKLLKEFGFIWYKMNEPIAISQLGYKLISAYDNDDYNLTQNIFLNSMVKYQTKNPFRQTLNDNVPLILLIKVINRFKKENEAFTGIARQELAFFICWKNNDDLELFNYIKEFRKKYCFSKYTEELIYEKCLQILGYGEKDKKYIKKDKIFTETTDEYIRKMRITGLISLRGIGNFIDINGFKKGKINYILKEYDNYVLYTDQREYFDYMSKFDNELYDDVVCVDEDVKINKLHELAERYQKEDIEEELKIVINPRRESKDGLFKFIQAPTRFEFLVSIALVQHFPGIEVLPNYLTDDEGIPTSHATGGKADIVCIDTASNIDNFVEVTLTKDYRSQMIEIFSIQDHQLEARKINKNTYTIFLAPRIHERARRCAMWFKFESDNDIATIDLEEFVEKIDKVNNLLDFYVM